MTNNTMIPFHLFLDSYSCGGGGGLHARLSFGVRVTRALGEGGLRRGGGCVWTMRAAVRALKGISVSLPLAGGC